ncbi:MAG: hypothetical protein A2Y38_17480 [Spirochaetes bacterium GWB1_59_5]|nr:MAG: hypothetical protein A2Y38_17480 [Spirochaetes bacterium GWB1_59_5]
MAQPTAVDVVQAYFEGADLVEGVEMTILDGGHPRPFPVCVCHGGLRSADQIISELQARLPAQEKGPTGIFGDQYPQFRKVFVFCTKGHGEDKP